MAALESVLLLGDEDEPVHDPVEDGHHLVEGRGRVLGRVRDRVLGLGVGVGLALESGLG